MAWIVRPKTTWHVAISLIAIRVMTIAKQCMNMYAKQTSRMISPSGSGALGKCDQCMIIKESIWSQQKVTKSGKGKCPAAARVGINPTPTVAECCKRFDNPLIPQFRNPTNSFRALWPKTAKNAIFLARTDFYHVLADMSV